MVPTLTHSAECLKSVWHCVLWSPINGPGSNQLVPEGLRDASSSSAFPFSAPSSSFFWFTTRPLSSSTILNWLFTECAGLSSLDNVHLYVGRMLYAVTPSLLAEVWNCLDFGAIWWKVLLICGGVISCCYWVISIKISSGVLNEYKFHTGHIFLFVKCDVSTRLVFESKE